MTYIYLPGFSPKNEAELVSNTAELAKAGLQVIAHRYQHWHDTNAVWDKDQELETALAEIKASSDLELGVIAKSIGTFIAMKLLDFVDPQQIILMGIPINDLDAEDRQEYLRLQTLHIPITVIQNDADTHGTSGQVEELLRGVDYRLITKSADHHQYFYPEDILKACHGS